MKAVVDKTKCVGCGLCADMSSKVFEMDGGVATVIADTVPASEEKATREAADNCPVEAIEIKNG